MGRRYRRLTVSALAFATLILMAGSGMTWAATRFVNAGTGNDASNDCLTLATPCKTINWAIGEASTGDTILVAAGLYPELVNVNKSVILLGAQTGNACDRPGVPTTESVVSGNSGSTSFYVTANNVIIRGFTVQNQTNVNQFGAGIVLGGGTSGAGIVANIIQDNVVGLFVANAVGGNVAVIRANKFLTNNNLGAASGTGIYTDQFVAGSPLAKVIIDLNCFIGNGNAGIDFSATEGSQSNVTMANNLFDGNGRAFFLLNMSSSTITGNTIKNSTLAGSGDIRIFSMNDGLTLTCNSITNGAPEAVRVGDPMALDSDNHNISAHSNYFSNTATASLDVLTGGYTPVSPGSFKAENNRWKAATGPAPGEIVAPDSIVDSVPFLSGVPVCAAGFPFRPILRAPDISAGPDVCGTGQDAINFTGGAGAGGSTWLAVYDTTPGDSTDTNTFSLPSVSADVLIKTYNNLKGPGLLNLFTEGAGQKGLTLFLFDAGNTDKMTLATVSQSGALTILANLSLGANVKECAWYRLTMAIVFTPPNITITGRTFRHTDPQDPNSDVVQVGSDLVFNTTLAALGVKGFGEVGLAAAAYSTTVN